MSSQSKNSEYQDRLKKIMDDYVHFVYRITRKFPKEELFGTVSQLRRSALSVPLNCVEGYARNSKAAYKAFLRIAFGSLKESEYIIEFSLKEGFISEDDYKIAKKLSDEIGAMIWGIVKKL